MSWESEIKAKNLERVLSVELQLNNLLRSQPEIKKSITDDLSYSEEFKIEKTGKEIKEKLQSEVINISSEKKSLYSKMEVLVKEIGVIPTGKSNYWMLRGFEDQVGEVPKQYCSSQIYPSQSQNDGYQNIYPAGDVVNTTSKETSDKMREYNRAADDYVRDCVDEVRLKSLINNISDNKKFKLRPQLAAKLGF